MQPINFKGVHVILAKDQEEYTPLPVAISPGPQGELTSVWEPTPEEREAIANGANIGLSIWTFLKPMQPVRVFAVECEKVDGLEVWKGDDVSEG